MFAVRANPNPIFEGQPTNFILDLEASPNKASLLKGGTFGLFRQRAGNFDTQPTIMFKSLESNSVGSASLAFGPFVYGQDGVFGAKVVGGGKASKVVGKKTKEFSYDVNVSTTVTVNNVAPSLDISSVTWAPYLTVGDQFTFKASASDPGAYDSLTYEWDFNYDGNFDAAKGGSAVAHSFSNVRSLIGAVRVFDGRSYSAVTTFDINVDRPMVMTPLPAAVWGGAALLGVLGVGRKLRRRTV